VVRVSGQRDAAAQLGSALNNPRQFMRFESSSAGTLHAGFDSSAVDRLLSNGGLPIWGKERPATLVLLNITELDGSSRWLDADARAAEREILQKAAEQRGLPLVWPGLGTLGQLSSMTDNGSTALLEAATLNGANATLLGRARRDASGALMVRWTLASSEGNAESAGVLEDGVHLAADTFARTYAASGSSLSNVFVEVSGLSNLDAYATTLNYLEGITLIRSVALDQVAGDSMRFRLAIRGDAATLRRAIALGRSLVPQTSSEAAGDDRLTFRYQP
jgi:hypothetical protein